MLHVPGFPKWTRDLARRPIISKLRASSDHRLECEAIIHHIFYTNDRHAKGVR